MELERKKEEGRGNTVGFYLLVAGAFLDAQYHNLMLRQVWEPE